MKEATGERKHPINRGAHAHFISASGINCRSEWLVKLFNSELIFQYGISDVLNQKEGKVRWKTKSTT